MEILICLDNTLYRQLFCLLLNLSKTCNSSNDISIHVIYSDLSPKQIKQITNFAGFLSLNVSTYEVTDGLCEGFPFWGHGSAANYYRLFFSDIIKPNRSRMLYLDLDILILADLKKLYSIELDNKPIGAHGFDNINFNSGIMLIDVEKWIDSKVPEKTQEIIKENKVPLTWWDNDILNHIFAKNWTDIGNIWNFMPEEFDSKKTSPFIVHFAGSGKPWQKGYNLPFSRSYRRYFRLSQGIYFLCSFFNGIVSKFRFES